MKNKLKSENEELRELLIQIYKLAKKETKQNHSRLGAKILSVFTTHQLKKEIK